MLGAIVFDCKEAISLIQERPEEADSGSRHRDFDPEAIDARRQQASAVQAS